ncbi:MAG: helix-turn-helix transcriptional regulator [Proteobacteria bacterium]|nr:helix-turn-helix transcriptional regulator [Pseudomonadota bacterium]
MPLIAQLLVDIFNKGQELHFSGATSKIERGEHMPTLAIIFKIAGALECSTAVLMSQTEGQLAGDRS